MRALVVSTEAIDPSQRGKLRALEGMGCSVTLVVPADWPPDGPKLEFGSDGGLQVVPIAAGSDTDPAALKWRGARA